MKTFLLAIVISIFISCSVFAQEETLLGKGKITNGGFGAPVVKYTQIKGEPAVLVGGRGGWIINHSFIIGGGGYGLVNNIDANIPQPDCFWGGGPYLNFGYGGLELEYIINSDQLLHYSISALIGGGGLSYRRSLEENNNWDANWNSPNDAFFVFEPSLDFEINIISFMRVDAGVSYRFISGVKFDDLSNSDLSGPSALLTFKFGKF